MATIKLGKEELEYQEINPAAVKGTKMLIDVWEKLGKPDTPMSEAGEKLMTVIVSLWQDLYPLEAKGWFEARKEYKEDELSISEQVSKGTGRSLASMPLPVAKMMKIFFPRYQWAERENCMQFVKKYPIFRFANKL